MKSVLVLSSGGIDSTVLVKHYLVKGFRVHGLYFSYGQPHDYLEYCSLCKIASELNFPFESRVISGISREGDFVPFRNALFLSLAINKAYNLKIPNVAYGACVGNYLDVYPEFVDRFNFMQDYCLKKPVYVLAPFSNWKKEKIIKYGLKIGAPLNLTYSCWKVPPCGECLSCKLRRKYEID